MMYCAGENGSVEYVLNNCTVHRKEREQLWNEASLCQGCDELSEIQGR